VPDAFLPRLLVAIGLFFAAANALLVVQLVRYARLRGSAVLTWRLPRPRFSTQFLLMAVALALVLVVKLVVERRPPIEGFGELMMFAYFGVLWPRSWGIERGFYAQGIWLDDGFLAYSQIGGLSWREGDGLTLLAIPRTKPVARRLAVPERYYGEARRLLRDRIKAHEIRYKGDLDLGGHDEREDV
jgi:hypothetical protein